MPSFGGILLCMNVDLSAHYSKRLILRTVWPSMLMLLVASVYSVIDGLFVANFTGTTGFAAVNFIMPVLMLVGALGLMVGTGGSALVSKTLGEGLEYKARKIFSMLVYFAIGLGVAMSVLLIVFMPQIAYLLGGRGELLEVAILYGRVYSCGMTFFILQMMFQSLYMTAERPQLGTRISVICGVVNIVLDALFVALFGWGVVGAALATIMSLAVGGIFPLVYFSRPGLTGRLRLVPTAPNWSYIGKACLNGSSEFVANIAISVVSMCYNIQFLRYVGEVGIAAYGIMMYVGYCFVAILQGYNIGISPIVSYHYGAQNHAELKSLLRKSVVLISAIGLLLFVLCEIFAYPFSAIFAAGNAELLQFTVQGFRLNSTAFLLCGLTYLIGAFFTALNNGLVSALISFLRTLVFEMAAVWLLPLVLGINGIWLSWVASEVLAVVLCAALLWGYRGRYHYL